LETFCCVVPSSSVSSTGRSLAFAKPVEQLDAGRLAQRSEPLGDQLDQVIGKRVRDSHCLVPSSRRIPSPPSAPALIALRDNYSVE
jgi:hypothetical protein